MIFLVKAFRRFRRAFCPLLISSVMLSLWGCLAIYDAGVSLEHPHYYALRQLVWLAAGIAAALTVAGLRPDFWIRKSPWLYGAGVLVLLLLFLTGGSGTQAMKGWFHTRWLSIQPSEFCKPLFILFLYWLHRRRSPEEENWGHYLLKLCLALLFMLPVMLQPDFGTLLIFGLIFAVFHWLDGGKVRYLAVTFSLAAAAFPLVLQRYPYVMARFRGFWDPEAYADGAGFHLLQLERALASGGFWGRSFGKGLWSQGYLPLTHNDSIFASFCEVAGFVGGFLLVALLCVAVFAARKKAGEMVNRDHGVLFMMLISSIVLQAFVHIAVNVQLFPPTGITLPFFSYGGSSLISSFIVIGLSRGLLRENRKLRRARREAESDSVQSGQL